MRSGASGPLSSSSSRRIHAELGPVIESARAYRSAQIQLEEKKTETLIADTARTPIMRGRAEQERADLRGQSCALDRELQIQLLQSDGGGPRFLGNRGNRAGPPAATRRRAVRGRPLLGMLYPALFAPCRLEKRRDSCPIRKRSGLASRTPPWKWRGRGLRQAQIRKSGVHGVQRVPAPRPARAAPYQRGRRLAGLPKQKDVDI